jgi:hypothetical protein
MNTSERVGNGLSYDPVGTFSGTSCIRVRLTHMKRICLFFAIALVSFLAGAASAELWISKHHSMVPPPTPSNICSPVYDPGIIARRLREDDDPQLFTAFQEIPLYSMPDCVDEAYGLTWIPSFDAPVLVRVWRSGNRSFMIAKELDTRSWSTLGNIKETNARSLTEFEWRDFTDLLNRASYWDLPSTVDEPLINDGAVWLVDGLSSKQYHWVRRRIANDQYAEICKHLIRLSGLETAHSLYLQ